MNLAISVLDLVAMRPAESAGSAIARSVETAQHVEKLGYSVTGWRNIMPFKDWPVRPRRF